MSGRLVAVTTDGLTFQFTISNHIEGGRIYWMVIDSTSGVPSTDFARSGDGFCAGNAEQTSGTQTVFITCPLDFDISNYFYIILDLNAEGTQQVTAVLQAQPSNPLMSSNFNPMSCSNLQVIVGAKSEFEMDTKNPSHILSAKSQS